MSTNKQNKQDQYKQYKQQIEDLRSSIKQNEQTLKEIKTQNEQKIINENTATHIQMNKQKIEEQKRLISMQEKLINSLLKMKFETIYKNIISQLDSNYQLTFLSEGKGKTITIEFVKYVLSSTDITVELLSSFFDSICISPNIN